MGSVGKFMSVLSTKAHEKAQTELDKAEQSKKSEIEVWKKVLDDPASSQEQRQKAVDSLNKLYNWKGKGDSPFAKLAGFMQHLGQKQGGQPPDSKTGTPPFVETQPGQGKPGASAQPVPAAKPGGNVFQKVGSGVGKGMGVIDSMLNQHPRELPPLDASAFPTGAQQREAKTAEMKAELEAKWPYEEKRIRLQEELANLKAKGGSFTKKGTTEGSAIPVGATDILGNAIDLKKSYDILENGRGEKQYVSSQGKKQIRTLADENGHPADFLVDLSDPKKLIKIGAKPEQAEYKVFTDPDTQEQYAKPVPRYTGKPGVAGEGKHPKELPEINPQKAAVRKLKSIEKEITGYKGISLGKKDTSTARAKAEQAVVVIRQGEDLIKMIEDNREALGPWAGRINSFEAGLGTADPKVRGLYTAMESFVNLQPALHGSRGIGMVKEFKMASAKLADNPDAAIEAIRSLIGTARHFAQVGGEGKNVPPEGKTSNVDRELEELEKKLKVR